MDIKKEKNYKWINEQNDSNCKCKHEEDAFILIKFKINGSGYLDMPQ